MTTKHTLQSTLLSDLLMRLLRWTSACRRCRKLSTLLRHGKSGNRPLEGPPAQSRTVGVGVGWQLLLLLRHHRRIPSGTVLRPLKQSRKLLLLLLQKCIQLRVGLRSLRSTHHQFRKSQPWFLSWCYPLNNIRDRVGSSSNASESVKQVSACWELTSSSTCVCSRNGRKKPRVHSWWTPQCVSNHTAAPCTVASDCLLSSKARFVLRFTVYVWSANQLFGPQAGVLA